MTAPHPVALVALLALFAVLALRDWRETLLPNQLVYPGIVASFAVAPLLPAGDYAAAAVAAAVAFAVFAAIYFAAPGAMGGGDVKYAALIGAALGPQGALYALMFATVFAALVATPMLATGQWTVRTRIAYGPYLSAGAATAALLSAL